ncbi:MAG: cytochrome C oxidase subunit IV family protein [Isosphaeraceae bacterium]
MSTDVSPQPAPHDLGQAHAPHLTVKVMLVIYVALLGLMALTILAATIDLGRANFMIAMGIATIKMVLILLYFMHVKYSPKLTWIFSSAAFLWLVILVVGILNDYFTRDTIVPGK